MPNLNNKRNARLLIINYAMNVNDAIFSHQFDICKKLSEEFNHITVITNYVGNNSIINNVTIHNVDWNSQTKIKSTMKFLMIFLEVLFFEKPNIIFYHMTEVQCALTSPIARLMHIRNYLWYAHASKSKYLNFSKYFVNGILTSTRGSCPILGDKIKYIGQSIDQNLFTFRSHELSSPLKLCHVGRLDKSKNILKLLDFSHDLNELGYKNTFILIGEPSPGSEKDNYLSAIKEYSSLKNVDLEFFGNKSRLEIPAILHEMDFFVHAYTGSLDKALLEATMCGVPVLTLNREYMHLFPKFFKDQDVSLFEQFLSYFQMNFKERIRQLLEMKSIVERQHSLDQWTSKLITIITSE